MKAGVFGRLFEACSDEPDMEYANCIRDECPYRVGTQLRIIASHRAARLSTSFDQRAATAPQPVNEICVDTEGYRVRKSLIHENYRPLHLLTRIHLCTFSTVQRPALPALSDAALAVT